MDELRARAFLDLVLGKDSRPRAPEAADTHGPAMTRAAQVTPPGAGPAGGAAGGFAGRVTLTVPLGTAAGLADRPGELAGHGPVDPWLARDLAAAAARNPKPRLVRDGDRRARPRRRPRLRPARTQEPQETRRAPAAAGRGRVLLHPGQPGRPARRVRQLAAARPGRRAGPDRRDRHPRHPAPASTGTRPGATTPGSGCGTCPRSGTPPAPAPCAGGPPPSATSSTTRRTRRAGGRACATGVRSVGMTTGSSSSPDGRSTSSPTAPSGGPPRPGAATTPNPPGTPSSEPRTRSR